jgi:hypothetical protein
VVLDLGRQVAEQVSDAEVSILGDLGEEDGMEDEDGRWKFVVDHDDRLTPNPAVDLHSIGVKSKFWALTDDDSDE